MKRVHEPHEKYMARMTAEEDMIASEKKNGGDHNRQFKIMPIEYIAKNKLDFCEGNIVKYISRHRLKNGAEDIKKVIHYAELILELEYGDK